MQTITFVNKNTKNCIKTTILGLVLFTFNFSQAQIDCNTDEPVAITSSNFANLTASQNSTGLCTGLLGCSISGSGNLINADLNDFATSTKGISVGVTHTFRVNNETSGDVFTGGNFAGFLVENTSALQVDLLNNIIVRTYLDGTLQETSDSAGLLGLNSTLLGGGDEFYAGFYTTEDFDAIEISLVSLLSIGGTTRIYYAVTDNLCAGPGLECNTPTTLAKPEFPARIVEDRTGFSGVSLGTITNELNAVDSDNNNFASINFILGVAGTANLSVQDALTSYPAQTYAGFDIENTGLAGLDLLGGVTITTYLDGVEAESFSGPGELLSVGSSLLTGNTRGQVGFVSSQEFDEVQISLQQVLGLNLGTTRIYGTVLQSFCEGPIECDSPFALTNPTYPVIINNERTGVSGVACIGCEVDDAQNALNNNLNDFALINVLAGVAFSASISVESVITDYNPGTIAGFVIRDRNNLVELDLISSLTITTYLDGQEQEVFDVSEDLLLLNVLNLINIGSVDPEGAYAVAFEATEMYDEVRLTVGSVVGALNTIEVYNAFVDATIRFGEQTVENVSAVGASDGSIAVEVSGGTPPYSYLWLPGGETTPSISNLSAGDYSVTVTDANGCQSTQDFMVGTDGVQTPIDCNTDQPVPITSANFSDLVVEQETVGLCIPPLCGVSGEDNLINNNLSDFATATTTLGVAVTHTFRVTDETPGDVFEAGNFAGFLIENPTVAQVDLLNAITVRTYLDGVEQESSTSVGLVGMETGLLGSDAYFPGFYTTTEFDAIEISISSVAGVLSETNVFYAATETFCPGPDLECNTPTALARPAFPARVVDERTGISGIGLGTITNQLNAIDSDPSNFANIDLTLGIASEASFSIKDELTSYPAQTYAGFDIENTGTLGVDLLDGITITTYLDGVEVESFSDSSELISIDSSLLSTDITRGQVGFVSSQEFDEVQITLSQTVSVDLGSTRIYGAVLQTFCEGPIECNSPFVLSNPTYPVIINNERTGLDGLACVACEIDDPQNVVSENPSDFALINITAGVATSASISVESVIGEYNPGTIAGFVIRDRSDLLEVNLLNSLTIRTYLDGIEQEEFEAADGFLGLDVLNIVNISPTTEEGVYAIAFETTETYDEVQLSIDSVVGAVNSIEVYGALIDATVQIEETITNETAIGANDGSITVNVSGGTPPYEYLWTPGGETTPTISNLTAGLYTVTVTDSEGCQTTAQFQVFTDGVQREIPCNTDDPVAITSEGFTDLVVEQNTDGVCVLPLCGAFDEDNLINVDQDDFALARTTIGLGVTHTFRVTDETVDEQFEAGGFAGFLIENSSILQVDLLNSITVRTYLDGVLQEESDTESLVAVGTTLLGTSD